MKKTFVILCFILTLAVFFGCNKADESNNSADTVPAQTTYPEQTGVPSADSSSVTHSPSEPSVPAESKSTTKDTATAVPTFDAGGRATAPDFDPFA